MKINIFIILLLPILLFSCGLEQEKKENNIVLDNTNNIEQNNLKEEVKKNNLIPGVVGSTLNIKEREVDIEVKNGELKVLDKVLIKKGRKEDFPLDFPIIDGGEIYQNSNMGKYAFIITDESSISNISNFYKTKIPSYWIFNKELKKEVDKVINDKTEKVLISKVLKYTRQKTDFIKEELIINIKSEIPNLIKDNLDLTGTFIEVKINDIYLNPEEDDISLEIE